MNGCMSRCGTDVDLTNSTGDEVRDVLQHRFQHNIKDCTNKNKTPGCNKCIDQILTIDEVNEILQHLIKDKHVLQHFAYRMYEFVTPFQRPVLLNIIQSLLPKNSTSTRFLYQITTRSLRLVFSDGIDYSTALSDVLKYQLLKRRLDKPAEFELMLVTFTSNMGMLSYNDFVYRLKWQANRTLLSPTLYKTVG